MARRIYCGNLPRKFSSDQLKALFEPFGKILYAKIVKNDEAGSQRGFGFVELESEDASKKAIEQLNHHIIENLEIEVTYVRDRVDQKAG